jgi:hypothetical protein
MAFIIAGKRPPFAISIENFGVRKKERKPYSLKK